MPTTRSAAPHRLRESWSPTRVLLQPSVAHDDAGIEDLDLAKTAEDPLMYFLTPTPSYGVDEEAMDFDMEFDAGIEDAKHPPPIVRSVSPSSLGGLSRPPPRPPTPPRSPATPDLEFDASATPDEHDDYMEAAAANMSSGALRLPRRLKNLASGKLKGHAKSEANTTGALLPPGWPSSHPSHTASRGRGAARSGPKLAAAPQGSGARARPPMITSSRLSPHAWREPSPDVWAIEEETQEELNSELGDSVVEDGDAGRAVKARAVDIPAARPKKKVRFVLPVDGSDKRMH